MRQLPALLNKIRGKKLPTGSKQSLLSFISYRRNKTGFLVFLVSLFFIFLLAGLLVGQNITQRKIRELQTARQRQEKETLENLREKIRRALIEKQITQGEEKVSQ